MTAQLTDASSGEHVWADSYDGDVADVFALQDELSGRIAAALVGDLNRVEAERAQQRGTQTLEAWSLYQVGLQSADRYSREGLPRRASGSQRPRRRIRALPRRWRSSCSSTCGRWCWAGTRRRSRPLPRRSRRLA
ncbi:MAG: hypothetical protein MZV49_06120 [Rhodopseudomonas palustris]|nr:hypothetical protein [Rhodopseudomonas palustris]